MRCEITNTELERNNTIRTTDNKTIHKAIYDNTTKLLKKGLVSSQECEEQTIRTKDYLKKANEILKVHRGIMEQQDLEISGYLKALLNKEEELAISIYKKSRHSLSPRTYSEGLTMEEHNQVLEATLLEDIKAPTNSKKNRRVGKKSFEHRYPYLTADKYIKEMLLTNKE